MAATSGCRAAIDVYLELGAPAPETIPRDDDLSASSTRSSSTRSSSTRPGWTPPPRTPSPTIRIRTAPAAAPAAAAGDVAPSEA